MKVHRSLVSPIALQTILGDDLKIAFTKLTLPNNPKGPAIEKSLFRLKTFSPGLKIAISVEKFIEKRQTGGQNVLCDFLGGKRTIESALQNQFWRAQKGGLVWSAPVPSKENDTA